MKFLASPRRRRRLAGVGMFTALAALVATAVVALDDRPRPPGATGPVAGVGLPAEDERQVRMTRAMRAQINATLERFVPAALSRERPLVAWRLAGPGLRDGTTKREWLRGDLPVHPYPWRKQRVDGWRLIYAYPNQVALDLLVQPPKRARVGPIVFGIDLVRRDRGWLVNSMFPAAVFSAPGERAWVVGAADFRAGSSTAKSFYERKPDRARLSTAWLAVPGAILLAVLLIPIAFALWAVLADRRPPGASHANRTRDLPPLPRSS